MRVSVSICRKKSKGFVLLWANTDFFFFEYGSWDGERLVETAVISWVPTGS